MHEGASFSTPKPGMEKDMTVQADKGLYKRQGHRFYKNRRKEVKELREVFSPLGISPVKLLALGTPYPCDFQTPPLRLVFNSLTPDSFLPNPHDDALKTGLQTTSFCSEQHFTQ